MKKNYYFKSFIIAVALTLGLSVSAQKSVSINFEDAAAVEFVSENLSDQVTTEVVDLPSVARSGSKVVKIYSMSRSIGFLIRETKNPIVVSGNEYVHVIIFAGSTEATPTAAVSMTNGVASPNNWGATPGFSAINTLTATKRYTGNKKYAETDAAYITNVGADMTVYPRLRCHPQSTNTIDQIVYFDDLVMYAHTSNITDLTAPATATDFAANPGTKEIRWTEGIDASTGVQMTYILRTTSATAVAPVLMPQTGYSVAGGAAGANAVGDWTVIATVPAGTTTYTDNSAASSTDYYYAIVHKDLAYNNSDALLSTAVNYTNTSINENTTSKFNCIGGASEIKLSALIKGENVSIYNITGAKVFEQKVENSNLNIGIARGIYLVRVSDYVNKVVVR